MMRHIFSLQWELYETELTLEEVMDSEFPFPTNNKKTIERIYYEVREEARRLRLQKEKVEKELKQEFKYVAFWIYITWLATGAIISLILR